MKIFKHYSAGIFLCLPDRPFHIFSASKSVNWRTILSLKTSIDTFLVFKIVKRMVVLGRAAFLWAGRAWQPDGHEVIIMFLPWEVVGKLGEIAFFSLLMQFKFFFKKWVNFPGLAENEKHFPTSEGREAWWTVQPEFGSVELSFFFWPCWLQKTKHLYYVSSASNLRFRFVLLSFTTFTSYVLENFAGPLKSNTTFAYFL